jgi:PAS domain S-box-containing protein
MCVVMLSPLLASVRRCCFKKWLLLLAVLLGFQLLTPFTIRGQGQARRVLVFAGYDPGYSAVTLLNQSITSTIRNGSTGPVEFFYEFQDNFRIPNSKYEDEMVSYLERKYEGENINLVLALGAPALTFLLKHESVLFPGVPKVYYFHDGTEQRAHELWPHITGVWAHVESGNTLDMALALQPDTQNVFVVSGNSDQDQFLREEAQKSLHPYEARVHFTYLTDLTIQELEQKVAALPPNSIVLYLSFLVDKGGNGFGGPEAVSRIAPTANAPVFGIAETYMGAGIVGGSLLDFQALGKRTGEVALDIMNGATAYDITPQTAPNVTLADWRQLRRWKLDENKLPAGTVVRFKQLTFWGNYKWYVIAIVAALLFQAASIAWLLFTRRRRRQAERENEHLAEIAASEHRRLTDVLSHGPGIVWESTTDPATGERKTTFVSDQVEKMLGYTAEEWLATPGFALNLVHEEDRERTRREAERLINSKTGGAVQFRWIAKDGHIVWAETHLAPIVNQLGDVVKVLGVTLDITQQKFAESARGESEERTHAILRAVPDLMFLQSRDGVYLDYHAKHREDLLVPPEQFLGKNMREILPQGLATQLSQCFARATNSDTQVVEYKLPLNGSERWFEARLVLSGKNILSVVRDITARKAIENALRQNEAQLGGIIGSAMDAIISIDDDYKVVVFNAAAEKIFNCSAAEAIGQSVDRFIPDRYRLAHREHISSFAQTNESQRQITGPRELYGLRASGEEFPIEASISQTMIDGKAFFTVILRDITERKRALDELCDSEQRFSKAFRANPQPMSLTTLPDGLYVDVNDSFLAMSGYTGEEILGHTAQELNIWETAASRAAFLEEVNRTKRLVNYEMKFRRKDGSFRTLLLSAEQLEMSGKHCLLVVANDVTDFLLTQQALGESDARFINMADTAPVMIWISDESKACTYFNKQWLDFTGRDLKHELVDGWTKGVYPEDYEHCLETYNRSFDRRETFEMEYRLRRKDGEYRWILDCGTPRFSSDGSFLGYIGSCIDITERKNAEVELRKAHEELSELKNQLEAENIYLQQELQLDQTFGEIVGQSDAIKYVLFKVTQVAPTDSTVLIMGETGTGKELVARAIHGASSRKDRPLIKVNCAALTSTLIESELFGHEKGAFTGASARKLGRFELANGGTIFLDEIGELPPELQVKLLRVIQEGEFERVGGTKTIKADVRIIAATNRNLKAEVEKGAFREDLWYRLNVFPITVPPLRQRKEDIPALTEHFIAKFAKRSGKTITSVSPRVMQALQAHSWPGNIRELANVIERAVIHTHGDVLQSVGTLQHITEESAVYPKTLEEVEREHIVRTLESTGWRIEGQYGAAKILDLNPSTLRTRMLKLNIQRRRSADVTTS